MLIEVDTEKQGRNIKQLEDLLDRKVETNKHTFLNEVKRILYIHNSDIDDVETVQVKDAGAKPSCKN